MTGKGTALLLIGAVGCAGPMPRAEYHEPREPCAARDPLRQVFWGDLHVHTSFSFDAYAFGVRVPPEAAYRFARGEPVRLPPLGMDGEGSQVLRLRRPLDFAAITDHSEFLGEIETCTVPGSAGYDRPGCRAYRLGGNPQVVRIGTRLTLDPPRRPEDICGDEETGCAEAMGRAWQRIQRAAAEAYDRSARCAFTSFVGYEYSGAPGFSTQHRNVIFRSDRVPAPITYFEQPTPAGLWRELHVACLQDPSGCDALAIPHNPNESNGTMFRPESGDLEEAAARAALRAALEPVLEVYQHKGDSECMNEFSGAMGAPDEYCDFEKHRRKPFVDCGEGSGTGGTARNGCFSRWDFARGALALGLAEEARLGVNPLRLGLIASTDTHNGTPGAVEEGAFIGHRGTDDDTVEKRLGSGELTAGGLEFSPGGLSAVWAEENSREAIFDAIRRREVYGTSGPRLVVRLFAGRDLPPGLCGDGDLLRKAYEKGVPMGGELPGGEGAPLLLVSALRDPDPGAAQLQLVQIVKGWIDPRDGRPRERVFDVAGRRDGAAVDPATCRTSGAGADALCAEFRDPTYEPGVRAFYYARVLEVPTCRWSTHTCNALPPPQRPPACSDPATQKAVQERAWTSPIWIKPS
jgi:hypothetical protein